ncbi:TonB-dependent receptor [Sphingomonas dokdonensis]|uniref:Pesticin receptor n=1 Tax=Sphingomonas dokdonensis TaxID=344880 RepID=A0A245ZMP0_9SPHN|nr:TonB-dependent receptor [Sphingomonas dokdonensis]OWK31004.1 pesticin receptor precursor [Sphingomonas dokdonensis]
MGRMVRELTGAAVIALLAAMPAMAQEAAPAAPPADPLPPATAASDSDIVVTAQRREQRLQDVPISMEVVTGETIAAFQATDFKSVQNYVPNVFVQQTNGNDTIYIRGFGSPPQNFSFDQAVSVYVDGVYAGRVRQALNPFFDVARVEVLRGPQGALYGKNTPAGAVSVVSAGPTKEFEGSVTGVYNFDLKGVDLTGYVAGPLSDTFGLRVAARVQDQDGYLRNRFNGKDEPRNQLQLFRVSALWTPTDTVDVSGKLELTNQKRSGGLSVSSPVNTTQRIKETRYTDDGVLGPEQSDNRAVLGSVTANVGIGDHTLTSITGYSWFNGKVTNYFDQETPTGAIVANSVYNQYPERFNQFSQEFRLLSPTGGTLEYVVGAYYDTSRYYLTQLGGFNIAALNYFGLLETNFRQKARSISVFGQATIRPFEGFRVIGSLRYTNTHKDGTFGGRLRYGPFALRPVNTTAAAKIEEGLTDPSVTLQYDFTRDLMVYAVYGRGSKSGGFVSNTYGTTDATFVYRPERSRNWEAGVKATLLDGKVNANVSVYDTKFTDLQSSVYNPVISTYQVGNAAAATSRGIEGSLRIAPSRYFDITASGAYQDVKYDDYPGAACLATQPLSQCNPASPASIQANNLAGYRLAYTSKFTGNVAVHGRADIGDYKLDGNAIVGGRSGFFNSDNMSPLYGYQRGFAKLDLRVQFGPQDEQWHVAVVGKNLTDKLTTGSAFLLPAPITSSPRAMLFVEPPRNIAIEAGVRF